MNIKIAIADDHPMIIQGLRNMLSRYLDIQMPGKTGSEQALTQREKQILQLIIDGHTDGEIAAKLYLSAYTVKHYRISLLFKLYVKNPAALVKKRCSWGLLLNQLTVDNGQLPRWLNG